MVEKPKNTYALGPYLQLLHRHLPHIADFNYGFILNFFDIVMDNYKIKGRKSKHKTERRIGKTSIQAGVWKGTNQTDLYRFYNGQRKVPRDKAASLRGRLCLSAMEELLEPLNIDGLTELQKDVIAHGISVDRLEDLPTALFRWLQEILAANAENKDLLADNIPIAPMLDIFEGLELSKGRIQGGKLLLGKSPVQWHEAPKPPKTPDTDIEGGYIHQLCLAFGSFDQSDYQQYSDIPEHHRQEYQEQRGYFWDAQGLRRNLRDVLNEPDVFDQLKDDLYDGVIDTCRDDYPNGLKRMRATLTSATRTQLTASAIMQFPTIVQNRHRKGMCHILTNEGHMVWVEES